MKPNRIALYIDLLFCLLLMPLIIMILPVDKWMVNNTRFLVALIIYIYSLYLVYRNVCIPKLFMEKKYFRIILLFLALLFVTSMFTNFTMPENSIDDHRFMAIRKHTRTHTIWFFFLIVTGFSLAIDLTIELFRQLLLKQEIESRKDKAELSLYKAQINPHFLFNTLNTLYALVLSGSDKTESAFVKFSDILRYMYTQSSSELISARCELEYINQYVDLQKLRLNVHTKVNLDIRMDNEEEVMIPPMILITFVENAFKYGSSSDTDCLIEISVFVNTEKLILKTENSVMRCREDGKEGIGIHNCRKRLDLLYQHRYELNAQEKDGKYYVFLNIQLK